MTTIGALFRGNSSVGRAIPCQGIGRRFEPGFPLQNLEPRFVRGFIFWMYEFGMIVTLAEWQSGYAAVCKTVDLGSIPGSASKSKYCVCPGGGIGRRKGLKIPRLNRRAGSIPAPGTICDLSNIFLSKTNQS